MFIILIDLVLRLFWSYPWFAFFDTEYKGVKIYDKNSIHESYYIGDIAYSGKFSGDSIYYTAKTCKMGLCQSKLFQETENVDAVVLGDSYTEPYSRGKKPNSWVDLVSTNKNLNILSSALSATSPNEQLLLLQRTQKFYNIKGKKLIWCLYSGNDLFDNYNNHYLVKHLNFYEKWKYKILNFIVKSPVLSMINPFLKIKLLLPTGLDNNPRALPYNKYKNNKGTFYAVKHEIDRNNLSLKQVREHWNYSKLVKTITVMDSICKSSNIELEIFMFPNKMEVYTANGITKDTLSSPFSFSVDSICKNLNIPFFDLKPHFIKSAEICDSLLWIPDDTHWNNEGHRVAAEYLEKHFD